MTATERQCNGICLTGYDVGVPEYHGIAYAHPDCELHGYDSGLVENEYMPPPFHEEEP